MKKMFKFSLVAWLLFAAGYMNAQQVASPSKRDGAYDKDLIKTREVIPYDHIREADVFWEKRVWRVIDFNEKMNLPFKYPVDPFMNVVYNAVVNGELTAFSPLFDDFRDSSAFTIEDVNRKFNRVDTIYTYNEETYQEEMKVVTSTFDYQTVNKIELKEDWIFDEETSTMVVRIIGVAPIRDRIDVNTGEPIGSEVMFWVYYPDLRPILIRHELFNEKNSARTLTYEDVFEMRLFSSYIVKEDNVYDRFIENYATGVDQVLESDRIKNEIFEYEHNLWEY